MRVRNDRTISGGVVGLPRPRAPPLNAISVSLSSSTEPDCSARRLSASTFMRWMDVTKVRMFSTTSAARGCFNRSTKESTGEGGTGGGEAAVVEVAATPTLVLALLLLLRRVVLGLSVATTADDPPATACTCPLDSSRRRNGDAWGDGPRPGVRVIDVEPPWADARPLSTPSPSPSAVCGVGSVGCTDARSGELDTAAEENGRNLTVVDAPPTAAWATGDGSAKPSMDGESSSVESTVEWVRNGVSKSGLSVLLLLPLVAEVVGPDGLPPPVAANSDAANRAMPSRVSLLSSPSSVCHGAGDGTAMVTPAPTRPCDCRLRACGELGRDLDDDDDNDGRDTAVKPSTDETQGSAGAAAARLATPSSSVSADNTDGAMEK